MYEDIKILNEEVPKLREKISTEDKKILHDFLSTYTPMTDPDSDLGKIYNEYVNHIEKPFMILSESQEPFEKLVSNKNEFSNSLSDSASSISKIENTFNDIADKVLDEWYTVQSNINSYGPTLYFLLCGVFCFFGTLGFLRTLFYCCCRCDCMKIMLHFTWNFFTLLSFFGMLIGSIFSLVGKVGSDAVGVVSFLFGDNLQSSEVLYFGQGESTELIDICINGDGYMEKKLKLNEMMEPLNELYNLSRFMTESYNNVSGYNFSELTEIKNKYDNYKDTSEWVKRVYTEVRKEMKNTGIMFVFEEDKAECFIEEKQCFNFEQNREHIQEIISQKGTISEKLENNTNILLKYIELTDNLLNDDPESSIRNIHKKMLENVHNGGDGSIKTSLKEELGKRKNFTDELYKIFSSMLGEPQDNSTVNVFDIINCGMYTYI